MASWTGECVLDRHIPPVGPGLDFQLRPTPWVPDCCIPCFCFITTSISVCPLVGGPQGHPQIWWFTGRSHMIQHRVIQLWFISVKGYSAKPAKWKATWGEVQGKTSWSFQETSLSGVTQKALNSSSLNCDNTSEVLSTRELVRDLVLRVFTGGWSCRYPVPSMYPNSILSEAFSTNRIVCVTSLDTVRHSYEEMVRSLPKPKFPDARQVYLGSQTHECLSWNNAPPLLKLCVHWVNKLTPKKNTHKW